MNLKFLIEKFGENYARYIHAIQLIPGILFILSAWQFGGECFGLLYKGAKTEGKIVELSKETVRKRNFTSTAYIPIVEFHSSDKTARFKDRMSTEPLFGDIGDVSSIVTVLYSPKNTSIAIIDRGLFNCLPWTVIFLIGLFLSLIGTLGLIKGQPEITNTTLK